MGNIDMDKVMPMESANNIGANLKGYLNFSGQRLSREGRRDFAMVLNMNKKFHKLQPYFDAITNHVRQVVLKKHNLKMRSRSHSKSGPVAGNKSPTTS